MATIRKDNETKVSDNFTEKEYYNASFGNVGQSFDYSNAVITGAQIIRNYYGVPMKVNASYRTLTHEISKGRSGKSQHTKKLAGDFAFLDDETLYKYHKDILTRGELYQRLRRAGITGFGLYDTFLHIDARPEGGNTVDKINGNFAFWDQRTWSKKKMI